MCKRDKKNTINQWLIKLRDRMKCFLIALNFYNAPKWEKKIQFKRESQILYVTGKNYAFCLFVLFHKSAWKTTPEKDFEDGD